MLLPIICLLILLLVCLIGLQWRLRNRTNVSWNESNNGSSLREQDCGELDSDKIPKMDDESVVDLLGDIEKRFYNSMISSSEKQRLILDYKDCFTKVCALLNQFNTFCRIPSDSLLKFKYDYEHIHDIIQNHNENTIKYLLEHNSKFFDRCLSYPLDKQQRRAIVSEEDNCLVISSAGSGKTSSIIGKVKYLIDIKKINPEKILLISYTNKAVMELTERLGNIGVKGATFHKLAIDIIAKNTAIKPSICDNTDLLFVNIFHELLKEELFRKSIVEYLVDYRTTMPEWEKQKNERREMLLEQKNVRIKALFPDMDGRAIYVKSEQEQKICFVLSSLGIKFRYEEPYEHQIADEMYSQYKPDFSIYFERDGKQNRVYMEHFGIDEHNLIPAWFAKEKNMSYDEANQKYNDGISWKISVHEKFNTKLLFTSSADFHYYDIKDKIKDLFIKNGIPFNEIDEAELYELVIPEGSKQEKALIRLIITFITLVKSNCKNIEDILQEAKKNNDERSEAIISNIVMPVYNRYANLLEQSDKIDFTDAILEATNICKSSAFPRYDYIIVDEFQDISIDRYNFLMALRTCNPMTKLYCVGDDWQSIYRFSGSDMALFNRFSEYFGPTEINRIETTYRFGEPLVSMSSQFIQRNRTQIPKNIHPFSQNVRTDLEFYAYERRDYCNMIGRIVTSIPTNKSIYLIGRYSFDDYYLSFMYNLVKEDDRFFYLINGRKIEFMTVHKSKGLEADYVILLQCNRDTYGFPSLINDDPILKYVLTERDQFPFGEERRLFYVAITRAKEKTIVLYDKYFPSVFVDEFLCPTKLTEDNYFIHRNANKRWTNRADQFLLQLHREGKSIKYISQKMGRSQTSIVMRLNKISQK
ncbi:MAG: UvrD-helicase domain-containing protein [Bacteroides sp.]|nr:UvrD-helicase domain-containing protein [Bacteroides sp.]